MDMNLFNKDSTCSYTDLAVKIEVSMQASAESAVDSAIKAGVNPRAAMTRVGRLNPFDPCDFGDGIDPEEFDSIWIGVVTDIVLCRLIEG